MTKTDHYQLPQWEAHDPIRRGDFNAAMGAIDAGLAGAVQAAGAAQETADTARTEAAALPYVVGSYRGSGDSEQDIVVGFRPSVVLIFADQRSSSDSGSVGQFSAASELITSQRVTITDTGFHVTAYDFDYPYPRVNYDGQTYQYIAFR